MSATEPHAVPASAGQRLLWIMDRFRGGNGMMGVPLMYRMRGRLDDQALALALARLCERHEALRTTFTRRQRALCQLIHAPQAIKAPHEAGDVSDAPDPERALATSIGDFLRAGVDPGCSPMATALWRVNPAEYVLVLNLHHLVTDAWSNMVIGRDLAALYSAAVRGTPADLPPVGWQYADYTEWLAGRLSGPVLKAHQSYWREHLRAAAFPRFGGDWSPSGRPHQPEPGAPMAQHWFALPPDLIASLRAAARAQRCTLFTLLLSAMLATVAEHTGTSDVTIGSVFANRAHPLTRQTVGFFANMVMVRASAARGAPPAALIPGTRRSVLGALAHEELPFSSIPFDTVAGTAAERARPEDVVFHMLAVPPDAGIGQVTFAGLETEPLRIPDGLGNRFNLEVLAIPARTGLDGVIRYTPSLFRAGHIRRFAESYLTAAQSLAHPARAAR